jgi:hypothetical protein
VTYLPVIALRLRVPALVPPRSVTVVRGQRAAVARLTYRPVMELRLATMGLPPWSESLMDSLPRSMSTTQAYP